MLSPPSTDLEATPRKRQLNRLDAAGEAHIKITLRDLIAPLVEATRRKCGWLDDFSDDEITMPADLYDVLRAYENLNNTLCET